MELTFPTVVLCQWEWSGRDEQSSKPKVFILYILPTEFCSVHNRTCSKILLCMLLKFNNTNFLVQFGNKFAVVSFLHLPYGFIPFWYFLKTHSCNIFPNRTQICVILITYRPISPSLISTAISELGGQRTLHRTWKLQLLYG